MFSTSTLRFLPSAATAGFDTINKATAAAAKAKLFLIGPPNWCAVTREAEPTAPRRETEVVLREGRPPWKPGQPNLSQPPPCAKPRGRDSRPRLHGTRGLARPTLHP